MVIGALSLTVIETDMLHHHHWLSRPTTVCQTHSMKSVLLVILINYFNKLLIYLLIIFIHIFGFYCLFIVYFILINYEYYWFLFLL